MADQGADKGRLNTAVWILYDFANSILMITFFMYFSQWLVVERGVSDLSFNILFAVSTLILLVIAPPLAAYADRCGVMLPSLRLSTAASIALYGALAVVANLYPDLTLLSMALFALANAAYQLTFVFYNPLLGKVADESRLGFVSGWGQCANLVGQISGLLMMIPFASGITFLFPTPGRTQTFLPAVLIFTVLSLPMLFLFREEKTKGGDNELRLPERLRSLFILPGVSLFFVSYFFLNDSILTAGNNFPIYLESVFKASDDHKSFIIAGILLAGAGGGVFWGWCSDRFGMVRSLIWLSLGVSFWFVVLPILTTLAWFIPCALLFGIFYGGVFSVTRALMLKLIPAAQAGIAFSIFGLFERFATFAGPLSWGAIATAAESWGPDRYRLALFSLVGFSLIAAALLMKLDRRRVV